MTLDQIRGKIAALQDERAAVEKAFPSWDETAADLAANVSKMSEAGRLALAPAQLRRGRTHARGVDAVLLAAAFDPAGLTERLLQVAREELPEPGLSSAERARRLAEIADELRVLQIREETLIRSSVTPIIRRGDADPEIVLTPDLDRLAA